LGQAALLHDVVEDTPTTVAEVLEGFGAEVASLVEWLTAPPSRDLDAVTVYYGRLRDDAPPQAHILKLADRTDNLRSIQALVMRTGDRYRRWAGRYLEQTQRQVMPLTATAPSIARVALVTAMADLAPLVGDEITEP
jgi:GTP pyrophosphokinase